jgi:hypothetical protein
MTHPDISTIFSAVFAPADELADREIRRLLKFRLCVGKRELPLKRHRQRTLRPPVSSAERVPIHKAVAILGLPLRTVQELSARGKIPGAAKLGRRWTFDIEKLRRLVRQRERETWQNGKRRPDATGGEIPSGHGLKFVGAKSDGRFTQVTRRLRGRNIKPAGSG